MKKLLIILFCILFLLTGCKSEESILKEKYNSYISELSNVTKSSKDMPFDIEIKVDRLDDNKLIYQFIMDNVKKNIYDIEALVIHDNKTSDIFPSIGIFDEKEDLYFNKKPKGIVLVGYIDYKGNLEELNIKFKSIIKYKDNNKIHKVFYVTK